MTYQPTLDNLISGKVSERARIIQALASFRKEWQENTNGQSLLFIEASVALILSDLADMLEFTQQERHVILGSKLSNEVNKFKGCSNI